MLQSHSGTGICRHFSMPLYPERSIRKMRGKVGSGKATRQPSLQVMKTRSNARDGGMISTRPINRSARVEDGHGVEALGFEPELVVNGIGAGQRSLSKVYGS